MKILLSLLIGLSVGLSSYVLTWAYLELRAVRARIRERLAEIAARGKY